MRRPTTKTTGRFVTVLLVLALVTWGTVGVTGAQRADSYSVQQGGQCVMVTPLAGDKPVREFYDYHSTIDDNPYTTAIGPGFSSEGTTDLQEAETSILFLYEDSVGNLSLVTIHGAREEGVDGGSASFKISGLPEDGRWAVKDDEYDSPNNTDIWRHGPTTAEIDWTWSRSATDGGAFAGLGDDFEVTIEPAFNEEAVLFGEVNAGVVEDWEVLSGDRENPQRTPLDLSENVTVSSEPCDGAGGTRDDGDDSGDVDGDTSGENGDDDGAGVEDDDWVRDDGVEGDEGVRDDGVEGDDEGDVVADDDEDGPPGDGDRGANRGGDDRGEPDRGDDDRPGFAGGDEDDDEDDDDEEEDDDDDDD